MILGAYLCRDNNDSAYIIAFYLFDFWFWDLSKVNWSIIECTRLLPLSYSGFKLLSDPNSFDNLARLSIYDFLIA